MNTDNLHAGNRGEGGTPLVRMPTHTMRSMNAAWIDGGIEESTPQGLRPPSVLMAEERAKPEGLAYLEASSAARLEASSA